MLEELRETYAVRPEPIREWEPYLQAFSTNRTKYAFPLQLKVLLSYYDVPDWDGTLVFERSPLATRFVFGHVLRNEGSFTQLTWELFKEFHEVFSWTPDLIIYVDTPADVCFKRLLARNRDCEKTVSLSYLENIAHQYEHMMKTVTCPTHVVHGTKPVTEVAREIRDIIGSFLATV